MGHLPDSGAQVLYPGPDPKGQVPGWHLADPEESKKTEKMTAPVAEPAELPPLAVKLIRQKKKKSVHGLYDYVQIDLTYSSSRMASNRLTRGQVESIFRKGKVRESFEPMKV